MAVLLVVGFHAAPTLVPGGFIGVDIFFVISGYLIAGLIWKELEEGRFSMLVFYARRCRRIIPALWVVLLATWLLGWHALFADEFQNLGRHVLGGAGFASNFVLAQETGYFDVAAETKPLLHLWSLAIEEQFYLVWPLIALLAFRRRYPMGIILAGLGIASIGLYLFLWEASPVLSFYLLPARFWEILAGAGLAYHQRFRPAAGGGDLKAAIAAAVIGITAFGLDYGLTHPRFWPIAAVFAALFLISAGPQAAINRRVLAAGPVVFVGLISYPLYLWHWPLLTFARISEGESLGGGLIAAVLGISLVLATLTWLLVERPLRYSVFRVERGGTIAFICLACGGIALAVAAVLGTVTLARDGFAGRHEAFLAGEPQPPESELAWRRAQYRDAICLSSGPFDDAEFCRRSRAPVRAAILGDSHANQLMPGLLGLAPAEGPGLMHVGNGGCPAVLGVQVLSPQGRPACRSAVEAYVQLVTSTAEIRTVLLASRVSLYTAGEGYRLEKRGASADAGRASNMEALVDGSSRLIATLQAAGKKVIVLTEVPRLGFDPKECVALRPLRFNPGAIRRPCTEAPDPTQAAAVGRYIDALKSRHPELEIVDLEAVLCVRSECMAMHQDQLLYRDRDHLSLAGSAFVASRIRAALAPAKP